MRLRREERLEHSRAGLGVHPLAVVRDGDHHVRPPGDPVFRGQIVADDGVARPRSASRRLGIASRAFSGKVDQHLLDLSGIDERECGRRRRHDHQVDCLADQGSQQLARAGDDGPQVDELRLECLAATERQQLRRQTGRLLGGTHDLRRLVVSRVAAASSSTTSAL